MRYVGLTGGIGSGKSSVARLLAARGAIVIDSDALAREVVEPGTPGLAAVVAEFGEGVLLSDGTLDRAGVAAIVFSDPGKREKLNSIVHPLVARRAAELTVNGAPDSVVVHDVPLLAETDASYPFDLVIVVDAEPEAQIDRLVRIRGMDESDARARMAAQASRKERMAIADIVVVNDGTLDELEHQIDRLWPHIAGLTDSEH